MQWLEDDFLSYLDTWEESVKEREGFSNAQQSMMLLSKETRLGLRITGTQYQYLSLTYDIECLLFTIL